MCLHRQVELDLGRFAHLLALEGYTEVLLAELYCSGIPLSTVDYRGDYTLRPGSSTEQVFAHAAALAFVRELVAVGEPERAGRGSVPERELAAL